MTTIQMDGGTLKVRENPGEVTDLVNAAAEEDLVAVPLTATGSNKEVGVMIARMMWWF